MEKFSLYPSFLSSNVQDKTFASPSTTPLPTVKDNLFNSNSSQKTTDFSQKTAFLKALNEDDGAPETQTNTLVLTKQESENENTIKKASPNAMLNILSLHNERAKRIRKY